jgi:hypothetical protein
MAYDKLATQVQPQPKPLTGSLAATLIAPEEPPDLIRAHPSALISYRNQQHGFLIAKQHALVALVGKDVVPFGKLLNDFQL